MGLMRNDPPGNRKEWLANTAFAQRIAVAVHQRNGFADQARASLEKAAAAAG